MVVRADIELRCKFDFEWQMIDDSKKTKMLNLID